MLPEHELEKLERYGVLPQLFGELRNMHAEALGDLRQSASELCEYDPDSNSHFSYHEHITGGDGVNGRRLLFVQRRESQIGPVYRVIINEEIPFETGDGEELRIHEYVIDQSSDRLSYTESGAFRFPKDNNWRTTPDTGPVLYKTNNKQGPLATPRLLIRQGNNYITRMPESSDPLTSDLDILDFHQRQIRLAHKLANILGKSYIGSVFHMPVTLGTRSKLK